jgi:hypothetical protein
MIENLLYPAKYHSTFFKINILPGIVAPHHGTKQHQRRMVPLLADTLCVDRVNANCSITANKQSTPNNDFNLPISIGIFYMASTIE